MSEQRIKIGFRDYKWNGVHTVAYKNEGSSDTFYNVDRQNIISAKDGVGFDVRYFECGPGGFTTLEKHQHVHIVMIARGAGRVIIGENIFEARPHDYFVIPSWAPHQLINAKDDPFAFFCSVDAQRDKFVRLSKEETKRLKENDDINAWIKIPDGYFDNANI
jgi:quercetin dioxygenase-like cupin family protein